MQIDAQSFLPQHHQLYELLKTHIREGVYQPGDLLPSEHALCRTHTLTRPTVRQALSTLVQEGYIKKQRGKGSIVQAPQAGIGILNIVGTTDSLPTGTLTTEVIEGPVVHAWEADTSFDLSEIEQQSGYVYLSRLRRIDGKPVFYEETYLPHINLPRITARRFENQSLFGILSQHYALKVTGGQQRIRAYGAAAPVVDLLNVAAEHPVLYLEKTYTTNRAHYRFFTRLWCNTEKYYLQGAL